MDKSELEEFFLAARKYMEDNWLEELEWVRQLSPETFKRIGTKEFLTQYVWTVYGSGFGEKALNSKFPEIRAAFLDFDLDSMCEMYSLAPVLAVFNNEKKANCVLRGARLIRQQGFIKFKHYIAQEGRSELMQLPGIGPINKDLFARNTGIASVSKNDIWLERLRVLFSCYSVDEMTKYLSQTFKETPGTVDNILWRFCNQSGWKNLGYPALEAFIRSLD
jgi:hypothetical protein